MNFYKEYKEIIWGVIGAILVIILGLVLPFKLSPQANFLEQLGLMQVTFSALAFFAVFIALILTIRQFRKSMAKPRLEVIFIDTSNSEIELEISKEKDIEHKLGLAVLNKGNAITNCFQIDLILPTLFAPTIATTSVYINGQNAPLIPHPEITKDYRLISFISNENDYCFVNLPLPIYTISIRTLEEKYNDYKDFKIVYKVYGDWAEPQEGTLKVKIKKQ